MALDTLHYSARPGLCLVVSRLPGYYSLSGETRKEKVMPSETSALFRCPGCVSFQVFQGDILSLLSPSSFDRTGSEECHGALSFFWRVLFRMSHT